MQVLAHFFRTALVENSDAAESSKPFGHCFILLAAIIFELEAASCYAGNADRLGRLCTGFLELYVRFRCQLYTHHRCSGKVTFFPKDFKRGGSGGRVVDGGWWKVGGWVVEAVWERRGAG